MEPKVEQPEFLTGSKIMNYEVHNKKADRLGRVEDIMIDLKAGRIAYAVLSVGGFLGVGDRRFPVPWSALQLRSDGGFILDVDKEMFMNAPGFTEDWEKSTNREWMAKVYQYYDYEPYWVEPTPPQQPPV